MKENILTSPDIGFEIADNPNVVVLCFYYNDNERRKIENMLSKHLPNVFKKTAFHKLDIPTRVTLSIHDNKAKMSKEYVGMKAIEELLEFYNLPDLVS